MEVAKFYPKEFGFVKHSNECWYHSNICNIWIVEIDPGNYYLPLPGERIPVKTYCDGVELIEKYGTYKK